MREYKLPAKSEKDMAGKIEEASGLLILIKPLLKRAGKLTIAEQSVMLETLFRASDLLSDVRSDYWKLASEFTKTALMVRLNGTEVHNAK